jgi:ketosteroid isomerase-like protein
MDRTFWEDDMRVPYALCLLLAVSSLPAAAAEQNLKQEVEKIASAYSENFNKQNAAGIAALYATGGVQVNQAGPTTDIAKRYEGAFKAGFNHNEITVSEVSPLGNDAAVSMGEYRLTGKNQGGAPLEAAGIWTAVDVREGGTWKIRMLSAIPKPAQPAK